MDCGGETGYSNTLASLLQSFQYKNETTGPDNSSANGKIERFNGTVKGGICLLITAVDWTWKVWNFAFYHYVRIYNSTPHAHGVPYTNVTVGSSESWMKCFEISAPKYKSGSFIEPGLMPPATPTNGVEWNAGVLVDQDIVDFDDKLIIDGVWVDKTEMKLVLPSPGFVSLYGHPHCAI
eukprot:scaffold1521_cov271-Chaetoceros_neogracile.AAC.52